MPLWVTKTSLPLGVRSMRVRYWSISPVEYAESSKDPRDLRMMS